MTTVILKKIGKRHGNGIYTTARFLYFTWSGTILTLSKLKKKIKVIEPKAKDNLKSNTKTYTNNPKEGRKGKQKNKKQSE